MIYFSYLCAMVELSGGCRVDTLWISLTCSFKNVVFFQTEPITISANFSAAGE